MNHCAGLISEPELGDEGTFIYLIVCCRVRIREQSMKAEEAQKMWSADRPVTKAWASDAQAHCTLG
jgi:hypothetical protein